MRRGELRRQHHAAHVFRPQRIHRHRRDNRRIDPARQAQKRLLEPAFPHVIAQRQHAGPVIRLADRRDLTDLAGIRQPPLRPPTEGDHHLALIELRQLRHQPPAGVQHHRRPIEHLVVLPAHHVQVHQRQPRLHHPAHHQVQPQVRLAPVIGRAIRDQQYLRPRLGQGLGHIRVPGILADRRADPHPLHHIGPMHIRRGEHPLFIEHRIVRQMVLQHPRMNPPALQHIIPVVKPAALKHWPADPQRRSLRTFRRQPLHRRHRSRHERRLQDQVLRLVARHEHLGQRDHVRPSRAPGLPRRLRPRDVSGNVPHHRVQLRQHHLEPVGHARAPTTSSLSTRLRPKGKWLPPVPQPVTAKSLSP
jgi:hypothetical protein